MAELEKEVLSHFEANFLKTFSFHDSLYNYMLMRYENSEYNDLLANILTDLNAAVYLKTQPGEPPEPVYLVDKVGDSFQNKTVDFNFVNGFINLFDKNEATVDILTDVGPVFSTALHNFANIVHANVVWSLVSTTNFGVDLNEVSKNKLGLFFKLKELMGPKVEYSLDEIDEYLDSQLSELGTSFFYYNEEGKCSSFETQVLEVYPNMFASKNDCQEVAEKMPRPLIQVSRSPLLEGKLDPSSLSAFSSIEKLFKTYQFDTSHVTTIEDKFVYALESLLHVFQPLLAEAFTSQKSRLKIQENNIDDFLQQLSDTLSTQLFVWQYDTLIHNITLKTFSPFKKPILFENVKPILFQNVPLCLLLYVTIDITTIETMVEAVVPLIPITIINHENVLL